ncbi:hypothetical protein ABVK25_003953 [Lepraria finkii]|uniref:Uncharacterized protein n=1 Tax=Lepraria finkii TaxID=1340010 RepID=A0ABR4BCY9_9LECA
MDWVFRTWMNRREVRSPEYPSGARAISIVLVLLSRQLQQNLQGSSTALSEAIPKKTKEIAHTSLTILRHHHYIKPSERIRSSRISTPNHNLQLGENFLAER